MHLIGYLMRKLANRSNKSKLKYLRKRGCQIGEGTRLLCNVNQLGAEPYLVEIGEDCLFSGGATLYTHDGGVKVLNSLNYFDGKRMDKFGKIKIGNNCFIGNGAKILPNVTLGDNVIIGAGSIVTKDIPSNSVAAGVPAKVICSIDEYYNKNSQYFLNTAGMDEEQKRKTVLQNIGKLTLVKQKDKI
jgi:acetyltransferase-like isoleucine patch superfamily enzyme